MDNEPQRKLFNADICFIVHAKKKKGGKAARKTPLANGEFLKVMHDKKTVYFRRKTGKWTDYANKNKPNGWGVDSLIGYLKG
jgi:hypothetical protein